MSRHPESIAAVLSRIPSLPRPVLERLVARMIDRMDELDGDADVEANGDELDGTAGEDDFYPHSDWRGEPGCPISDPAWIDESHEIAGVCHHYGIDQTKPLDRYHGQCVAIDALA